MVGLLSSTGCVFRGYRGDGDYRHHEEYRDHEEHHEQQEYRSYREPGVEVR